MKAFRNLVIYMKDHCPSCVQVKNFLCSKNMDLKQISLNEDPMACLEWKRESNLQLVPPIFMDGKFIYGATDFFLWMDG